MTDKEADRRVTGTEMREVLALVTTRTKDGKTTISDLEQFKIVQAWQGVVDMSIANSQSYDAVKAAIDSLQPALRPAAMAELRRVMPGGAGSVIFNGIAYDGAAVRELREMAKLSYEAPPKDRHTVLGAVVGGLSYGMPGAIVGGIVGYFW